MEAIALSPPIYSAKKRPLEFVSLNHGAASMNEQTTAAHTAASSSSWMESNKRSRLSSMNDENYSPSRHDAADPSASIFKKYDPNMFASSAAAAQPMPSYPHPSSHGYHDTAYINTVKEEYERKLHQKDEQIVNLTKISKQVYESHARLDQENKALAEENKLLKKAFGIQDSRMRELLGQNQQCQQMIEQMAQYLANLEQANYQLREELRNRDIKSSGGNHTFFQPPDPPPDVY